jgi:hypothetical protein
VRVQLLSDLHVEHARSFVPEPAPDATMLVLAGDVGHSPAALDRFGGWPVPILFVPGNHEFDNGDLDEVRVELRRRTEALGMTMLDRSSTVLDDPDSPGRRIRFIGATRWCDFDLLGRSRREDCAASAERYLRHMRSEKGGRPLDARAVRELALGEREWLDGELSERFAGTTVVITHFAPSPRSADPRYGLIPSTASFCNDDRELLAKADWWLHGHVHCAHDYVADNARKTRVVCNARGFEHLREHLAFRPQLVLEI